MSRILDQTADTSHAELFRISKLYSPPDFVKQASPESLLTRSTDDPAQETNPELSTHVFADTRNRQFPCHTKAATWLSYAWFLENRGEMPEKMAKHIEQRLDNYASYWTISPQIDALKSRHAELYKDAESRLPDSSFALVVETENGLKQRDYPLRNPLEVKTAASWFLQNRDAWPYSWRQKIANKILEKAGQFGVALDAMHGQLEQCAGHGFCTPKEAAALLRGRTFVETKAEPPVKEAMRKLADEIENAPALCVESTQLQKVAEVVDQFDRKHNLVRNYGPEFSRPEEVLFNMTYKEASATVASCFGTATGYLYSKEDLRRIDPEDLHLLFGDKIAGCALSGELMDVEKVADAINKLSYKEALAFDQLVNDAGVYPVAQGKHQRPRLTQENLLKAAAAYGPDSRQYIPSGLKL